MPLSLMDCLRRGDILVSDGALGTQLQQRGMPTGHCPEEYNVSHPEVVQGIHRDYYRAGSDLVSTNSFGGNRARLKRHGFEHRVVELGRRAAELAKEICPAGRWVAGSIGPTGEMLEPFGPLTTDEAFVIFAEQARALADGGVDFLLVETMMAIEEAETAVRAAKQGTGLPVAATMTFQPTNQGYRTMWGVGVEQAVSRLSEAEANMVGANCGHGFEEMAGFICEMRPLTAKPLIAQANAGVPELVDGKPVYQQGPEAIAPWVEALLRSGVNIIGGCCGTTPAHIAQIRQAVDHFRRRS